MLAQAGRQTQRTPAVFSRPPCCYGPVHHAGWRCCLTCRACLLQEAVAGGADAGLGVGNEAVLHPFHAR